LEYWENKAKGRRSVTPEQQTKRDKLLRFFSLTEKIQDE
jgi:hypothetical protein